MNQKTLETKIRLIELKMQCGQWLDKKVELDDAKKQLAELKK